MTKQRRDKLAAMRKKKTRIKDEPIPNPLIVDEDEFKAVVRKMVNAEPTKLEEIRVGYRKNSETDPRYLPVFDFPSLRKQKRRKP